MPRPIGYKVTRATRLKIAAARRGIKITLPAKFQIGLGVRHGIQNKVKVGLRFNKRTWLKFKQTCRAQNRKLGPTLEDLMEEWMQSK